jgi:SnoaL-like domain
MNQVSADSKQQELVDRAEIADLVSRLGMSLDEGRFDEMPSLLVEEATARTPGGAVEGREAVVAQARKNHRPAWGIEHVITNVLVDLDGDRAEVRANLVLYAAAGGPPDADGPTPPPLAPAVTFTMGSVYRIAAVRTGEGWRLSRVDTVPVWMSGTRPRPA